MAKDRNEMQKINETSEAKEQNEQMGVTEALNRYGFVVLESRTMREFLDSFNSSDFVAKPEQAPLPPAQLDPLQREAMIEAHMIGQRARITRYRQQKTEMTEAQNNGNKPRNP